MDTRSPSLDSATASVMRGLRPFPGWPAPPTRRSVTCLPARAATHRAMTIVSPLAFARAYASAFSWAFALALVLAALTPASSAAGDWPTIGGSSERHGQSPERGPSGADLLWQGTVNALFGGSNFTWGDRLVTWRFQSINTCPIVCYGLTDGQLKWSVDFPGTNSRSIVRGVRDGRVYATNFMETQQDTIIALSLADGHRLWVSPARAPLGIIWTAAFAPDGDLVLPVAPDDIARLDAATGQPVWVAPRTIPNTGAEHVCVHGNTVYGFEGSIVTPKVLTAWDLDTGARKYSSAALAGDGDQEIPFSIAPDGTIYVKRDGAAGLLHALRDDGTAITQTWAGPVNFGGTVAQLGIGLDGSVYVPDGTQLVRLDPATGLELDRSVPLVTSSTLNPRFCIGADGTIYCGNGGSADGAIYALSPDLSVLWSAQVSSMVYGAPALGQGGHLAVSGGGTTLRVYRPDPAAAPDLVAGSHLTLLAGPNPFREATEIRFRAGGSTEASLLVFGPDGSLVRRLAGWPAAGSGDGSIRWDGRDEEGRRVAAGTYFLRLAAGGDEQTGRVIAIR